MERPENDQWLDKALADVLASKETRTDFEQWKQQHPQAVEMLTSRANRKASASLGPLTIKRIIMKNPITKCAAAAVIGIAILVSLPFFSGNGASVVLANVLTRIEQARAFTYKMKVIMAEDNTPGMPAEMDIIVTVSNEYGMKWETDATDPNSGQKMTQRMYVLPDQKMIVGLMPSTKQYMRMKLDDDWVRRIKKQNSDPREVITQILTCEYTELGKSVIDGVKVEGFQTTDPTYFGGATEKHLFTLWIDAESWLPYRSEMAIETDGQMRVCDVTYDYQWDIPVHASEFAPVIPEDYTAVGGVGSQMPDISEEAAIEGLKLFAEITGRYPTTLDMKGLVQDISRSFQGSEYLEYLRKKLDTLKEEMSQSGEPTKEEFRSAAMEKSMELMRPLQSPGWFYLMLAKGQKEPVYYGQSVGPDDADTILLRWKVSDNEYRAIFGDLSVGNATAEQLAELEK